MTKTPCISCEQKVLVTDEQRKRFDAFVCGRCYEPMKSGVAQSMPAAINEFSNESVDINGRRYGVAYIRVA